MRKPRRRNRRATAGKHRARVLTTSNREHPQTNPESAHSTLHSPVEQRLRARFDHLLSATELSPASPIFPTGRAASTSKTCRGRYQRVSKRDRKRRQLVSLLTFVSRTSKRFNLVKSASRAERGESAAPRRCRGACPSKIDIGFSDF